MVSDVALNFPQHLRVYHMIHHLDGKVCGGLLALPPLLGWGEYNIMDNGIRLGKI